MVTRNDKKKGGAVRPCALIAVKPMSLRIVGRKTGSDEKLTLQLKYMSCHIGQCSLKLMKKEDIQL
jgi:hypothetical protein